MTVSTLAAILLVPLCWLFLVLAAGDVSSGVAEPKPAANHSSGRNLSSSGVKNHAGLFNGLNADSSMIQRALYVLIGITGFGVLYFLIRAVRLKKPAQRKKYGLLAHSEDTLEMEAVESDEDNTLYEARSLRR